MVILNVSFIMELKEENRFLDWFRALVSTVDSGSCGNCRLSAMRDANGEDYSHAEAQTISAQWEFPSLSAAKEWREATFRSIESAFMREFAPDALCFTSIFEVLDQW